MSGSRSADVELADGFFAEGKTLAGEAPEFGPKKTRSATPIWETVWPIANSAGVVESGQLRVNYAPASDKLFSICLVFRCQCIFRTDFVAPTIICGPIFILGIQIGTRC
jgi:hypothetical protein